MKRKFLRWCIGWFSEGEASAWLRSATDGDVQLGALQAELRSMENLLREDAQAWIESSAHQFEEPSLRANVRSTEARGFAYQTIAICLAASLAVVTTLWWTFQYEPSREMQVASVDLQGMQEELRSLIVVVDDSLHEMEESVVLLPRLADDAAQATAGDLEAICLATKRHFESSSRLYGQTLAFIQDHVRRQIVTEDPSKI